MLTGVFGAFVKGAYGFLRIWVFLGSSAKVVTGSAIHAVLSKGAKALGFRWNPLHLFPTPQEGALFLAFGFNKETPPNKKGTRVLLRNLNLVKLLASELSGNTDIVSMIPLRLAYPTTSTAGTTWGSKNLLFLEIMKGS